MNTNKVETERYIYLISIILILISDMYCLYLCFSDGLFFLKDITLSVFYPCFKDINNYTLSAKTKFILIYCLSMAFMAVIKLVQEEKIKEKNLNAKFKNNLFTNILFSMISIGFIVYRILYI